MDESIVAGQRSSYPHYIANRIESRKTFHELFKPQCTGLGMSYLVTTLFMERFLIYLQGSRKEWESS